MRERVADDSIERDLGCKEIMACTPAVGALLMIIALCAHSHTIDTTIQYGLVTVSTTVRGPRLITRSAVQLVICELQYTQNTVMRKAYHY